MDYCAYCGAKMQEAADSCPVCGRWRQQVQIKGGAATVAEPGSAEKTKVFNQRSSAALASENRLRQAEQAERERQARRAAVEEGQRTTRYLQNNDPATQPASLYDPNWNNEAYWQELSDRPTPSSRGGEPARQNYSGASQAGYRQAERREAPRGTAERSQYSGGRQQRQQPQQARQGAYRSQGGQSRSASGGNAGRRQPQSGSGASQRPRQPQRQRSAMQQLQSDVGPAMREVRTRVQRAAGGVATAISDPRSNERRILSVVGLAAAALIVLLIIIKLFTGGGEKAVLKKLAKAYESQKPEAVEALSSDLMKALYPGDQLTTDCRNAVGTVKDYFSARLGSSYRMSSKIEITENYTGAALAQQMESTFGVFGESYDMSRVKEMTKATLTLKAKHGHTAEKRIQVILVKEDGKWRLASQNL